MAMVMVKTKREKSNSLLVASFFGQKSDLNWCKSSTDAFHANHFAKLDHGSHGLSRERHYTLSRPIVSHSFSEDPFDFRTVIRAA